MKPLLTVICPSLEHRNFVDQASLKRMRDLPVEFLRLSDNDYRSTGLKTVDLIRMARGTWIVGMGDDDILHPSYFDFVLRHLKGPRYDMVGYNVQVMRDGGHSDLLCKVSPTLGPFKTVLPGTNVGIEDWDGDVQKRPYAMVTPVRKKFYDNLDVSEVINKSWCEDNYLMAHIIPQLKPDRCLYLDRVLYLAMPLGKNPDRKEWSTRYDD